MGSILWLLLESSSHNCLTRISVKLRSEQESQSSRFWLEARSGLTGASASDSICEEWSFINVAHLRDCQSRMKQKGRDNKTKEKYYWSYVETTEKNFSPEMKSLSLLAKIIYHMWCNLRLMWVDTRKLSIVESSYGDHSHRKVLSIQ